MYELRRNTAPVETSTCVRIAGYRITEKDHGYIVKVQDTGRRTIAVFRISEINENGIRVHMFVDPSSSMLGRHGHWTVEGGVGMWFPNNDYFEEHHRVFRLMGINDEMWKKLVDHLEMRRVFQGIITLIEHPHAGYGM